MEITFENVFQVLRKSLVLIIICAIIGGAGAFCVCEYLVTPTYVSSLEINIIGAQEVDDSIAGQNNQWVLANRLVKNCIGIINTNMFKEKVMIASGLDHKPKFTVSYDEETTIIGINVHDSSKEDAFRFAQTISEIVNDHLIESTATSVSVRVIENPVIPEKASAPDTMFNTLLTMVIFAAAVFIIQILREVLGTKIKDESELQKRYDIPVIASIPDFNEAFRNSGKYSYTDYYSRGNK